MKPIRSKLFMVLLVMVTAFSLSGCVTTGANGGGGSGGGLGDIFSGVANLFGGAADAASEAYIAREGYRSQERMQQQVWDTLLKFQQPKR